MVSKPCPVCNGDGKRSPVFPEDAPRLAERVEKLEKLLSNLLAEYQTHDHHNAYQLAAEDLHEIRAALADAPTSPAKKDKE